MYYPELEGRTMYALGDSIFNGNGIGKDKAYPSLLAQKYNMSYVNDGVSGSTIANFEGYPDEKIPMCVRWRDTLPKAPPDILLFEGGLNDRSRKIPIGDIDSYDEFTFLGALNSTLDKMSEAYPDTLIICVTGWRRVDKWLADDVCVSQKYADAMLELCRVRNVPCIDASDVEASHIDMTSEEFRKKYSIAPDDIGHLNEEGMKRILPYIERKVAGFYRDIVGHRKNDVNADKA